MNKIIELTKMSGELVKVDVNFIFATEVINAGTRIHIKNSNLYFDVREGINGIFPDNDSPFEFYVS